MRGGCVVQTDGTKEIETKSCQSLWDKLLSFMLKEVF